MFQLSTFLNKARSPAVRDGAVLLISAILIWIAIEGSEICTRVFAYVAAHPETEVDSVILAGILMSVGMAIFAWRRWREALVAETLASSIARHDALTGILNRRALMIAIDAAITRGAPFSCLLIDLDKFKQVNDLQGHVEGDRLLQDVSAILLKTAKADATTVARLGGDEFAILHYEIGGDDDLHLAQRVIYEIETECGSRGSVPRIGCSVGLARYPQDATDGVSLLRKADIALYDAKSSGRGRARAFEPAMDEEIQLRARLGESMRTAICEGEITPHFQPLIELSGGDVVGYEVLARWRSPIHGDIPPSVFIPIAVEMGLVSELSYALLLRACSEAVTWSEPLRIAINIAPRQLLDEELALRVMSILTQTGLAPGRLEIEVTEDALVEDPARAGAVVKSLKNIGVTLSLDDFGTGYSSLYHLSSLPFDKIKIDRSFIEHLATSETSQCMVTAIVGLGRSLNIPVLAEGVETHAQADMLSSIGCEYGQGWLYGAAKPANELRSAAAAAVASSPRDSARDPLQSECAVPRRIRRA